MKTMLVIAATLGLAGTGAALAQTTAAQPAGAAVTTTPAPAPVAPAKTPQEFVDKAASGGMFEVMSSELALKTSKSAEVQEFAKMMIADHTKANDELKALAESKKLTVPAEMMGPPAEHMEAVKAASAEDFDKVYVEHQAKAHDETIAMFEAEAKDGTDADLRGFAEKTLPTLKKHAEHVQMMMKK